MTDPQVQALILSMYYSDKRSMESIARELGANRKTVIRIVRRREVRLDRSQSLRKTQLDPFKEVLKGQLLKDPKVTGTALLNQLRSLGYTGGITILRDFLLKERGQMVHPREAFLRLDFGPGEVAQVDWGEFGGGVPRECWYDNLATAVSDRMGSLIRFNARFMAYMAHHSVRPHACNVARGNEKGRVEDLIKYIRMNFWSGRTFVDFDDLTKQLFVWRNQTANQREHRSTRRVVRLFFESEEKPKLMALNPVPYDTEEIFSRSVTSDFHFQFESNRYSVPWTLVGMTVTVRVNNRELKVHYNQKFICSHERSYLKNKVFTTEAHRAGLLERKPGASRETWQLGYVKGLGPRMAEYVELVRQGPRSLKYELSRLVALVTVYGQEMVLTACAECLGNGIVGVDNLELYLKRQHHPSRTNLNPQLINFNNEKLNRVHSEVDLRKYDALYFEGENNQRASDVSVDGNNKQSFAGGPGGPGESEAAALGSGDAGGPGQNEGSGPGANNEVPEHLDPEGEGGTSHFNDPEQDPNSH